MVGQYSWKANFDDHNRQIRWNSILWSNILPTLLSKIKILHNWDNLENKLVVLPQTRYIKLKKMHSISNKSFEQMVKTNFSVAQSQNCTQ